MNPLHEKSQKFSKDYSITSRNFWVETSNEKIRSLVSEKHESRWVPSKNSSRDFWITKTPVQMGIWYSTKNQYSLKNGKIPVAILVKETRSVLLEKTDPSYILIEITSMWASRRARRSIEGTKLKLSNSNRPIKSQCFRLSLWNKGSSQW